MGRSEDSSDGDLSDSILLYKRFDIFEMDIDVAIGGMDQRKAHMYMRALRIGGVGTKQHACIPQSYRG